MLVKSLQDSVSQEPVWFLFMERLLQIGRAFADICWKSQVSSNVVNEVFCIWEKAGGSLGFFIITLVFLHICHLVLFIYLCRSEFLYGLIYLLPKEFPSTFLVLQVCWSEFSWFLSEKVYFCFIFERCLCGYRFLGWLFFFL